MDEALNVLPEQSKDLQTVMLRAQLLLSLKRQKECLTTLITMANSSQEMLQALVPLVFRLANNYKLLQIDEFVQFTNSIVETSLKNNSGTIDISLLESLISIG